jgi:hypothetical protein
MISDRNADITLSAVELLLCSSSNFRKMKLSPKECDYFFLAAASFINVKINHKPGVAFLGTIGVGGRRMVSFVTVTSCHALAKDAEFIKRLQLAPTLRDPGLACHNPQP